MNRLEGKIALVTGAARGIGAGIARAFAAEGASVWVTDIDDAAGAQVVRELGERHRYERLDVGEEQQWRGVVDRLVAAQGRLDILVNNAGITGLDDSGCAHDPEHVSLDEWHRVHRGQSRRHPPRLQIWHSRDAVRGQGRDHQHFLARGAGRNPRSCGLCLVQGGGAQPQQERCLVVREPRPRDPLQLGPPAATMTPIWDAMLGTGADREERIAKMVRDTPLRRFGTVEEAALVVFLASDEAPYIIGSELDIDGGLLAGSAASPN